MGKNKYRYLAIIVFVFTFVGQAYCQQLSDIDAEIIKNHEKTADITQQIEKNFQEQMEGLQSAISSFSHGRSSTTLSTDPAKLSPLLGTKWLFGYNIGASFYSDTIIFESTVTQSEIGAFVACKNTYGQTGVGAYSNLSGDFVVIISGSTLNNYYFFKISDNEATGQYQFKTLSGNSSSYYIMVGSKLSGSTNESTDPPPPVDISNCKIMAKSLTLSSSSIPTTNDTIAFTVDAVSDCQATLYYYYSYAPDYGTDDYGKSDWVKMVPEGNGFTSNSTVFYKFPNPGYYVVVAWISPQMSASDPINMIGCTVPVK